MDNSIIKNTLGTYTAASGEFEGINRLNIFMFIEDVNMLLPVETFHDEATNTVYTTTDRMGTYCLVDMELWLDLLGIKPQNADASEQSVDNFSVSIYNEDNASVVKTTRTDIFDVVFMVDQVNYSNEQLDVIKDKIAETSTEIWKRTPEATVVIYGFNGDGKTHFKKYGRAGSENPEALAVLLDNLTHAESVGTVIISKAINHLITESDISENRIYCFTFFDSLYDLTEVLPDNSQHKLDEIKSGKYDVNISIVSNIPEESENNSGEKENYATALYNQTNGISIDIIDFVERSLKHIYGEKSNQFGAYNAIIATGYHTIVLDAPITIGYREAAEDVKKNPQNFERYKRSGMVDTDDDGLLDFQEINFEIYGKEGLLVQFDEEGYIKELPLATVCSDLYVNTKGKEGAKPLTYVEKGWKAFENSIYYSDLSEIHILPIKSDPTSEDGDKDGFSDKYEHDNKMSELSHDSTVIVDSIIDDTHCLDESYSIPIDTGSVYCDAKIKYVKIDEEDINETKKATMTFERKDSTDSVFTLIPEENSDYLFENSEKYSMSVYREYWNGKKEKMEPVIDENKNKENLYALEKGNTYKIYVDSNNSSDKEYTFTVQQDNWVYAPNGGIQTWNTSLLGDYRRFIYLSSNDIEFIVEMVAYKDKGIVGTFKIDDIYSMDYAFETLKINKTTLDELRLLLGTKMTELGAFMAFLPPNQVVTIISGTATLVGFATIYDWDGKKELNDFYLDSFELRLIYEDYRYSNFGLDYSVDSDYHPWNTSNYIYKYQNVYRTEIDVSISSTIKGRYCDLID